MQDSAPSIWEPSVVALEAYNAGERTQCFVHAKLVLCHLERIPGPSPIL